MAPHNMFQGSPLGTLHLQGRGACSVGSHTFQPCLHIVGTISFLPLLISNTLNRLNATVEPKGVVEKL